MTIEKIIGNIRLTAKAMSHDTDHSDPYIYEKLKNSRATFLGRRARSRERMNIANYLTLRVPLQKEKSHGYSCIPKGCDVAVSTYKLPEIIDSGQNKLIKVQTVGREVIAHMTPSQVKANRHTLTLSKAMGWDIEDGKLIIWNNPVLQTVMVQAIFADPLDLEGKQYCDLSGTPCFDSRTQDFPLDSDLVSVVVDDVVQKLILSKQIIKDDKNDRSEPEKALYTK